MNRSSEREADDIYALEYGMANQVINSQDRYYANCFRSRYQLSVDALKTVIGPCCCVIWGLTAVRYACSHCDTRDYNVRAWHSSVILGSGRLLNVCGIRRGQGRCCSHNCATCMMMQKHILKRAFVYNRYKCSGVDLANDSERSQQV